MHLPGPLHLTRVERVAESAEVYFNQLMMVSPPTNQQVWVISKVPLTGTMSSGAVAAAHMPTPACLFTTLLAAGCF